MKKFWFLIATENDRSFQSILKRIKKYSNDVYDYEVSKRFDIDGIIIRSISIVCSEETIEKIKDCGYMTKNVVIKD